MSAETLSKRSQNTNGIPEREKDGKSATASRQEPGSSSPVHFAETRMEVSPKFNFDQADNTKENVESSNSLTDDEKLVREAGKEKPRKKRDRSKSSKTKVQQATTADETVQYVPGRSLLSTENKTELEPQRDFDGLRQGKFEKTIRSRAIHQAVKLAIKNALQRELTELKNAGIVSHVLKNSTPVIIKSDHRLLREKTVVRAEQVITEIIVEETGNMEINKSASPNRTKTVKKKRRSSSKKTTIQIVETPNNAMETENAEEDPKQKTRRSRHPTAQAAEDIMNDLIPGDNTDNNIATDNNENTKLVVTIVQKTITMEPAPDENGSAVENLGVELKPSIHERPREATQLAADLLTKTLLQEVAKNDERPSLLPVEKPSRRRKSRQSSRKDRSERATITEPDPQPATLVQVVVTENVTPAVTRAKEEPVYITEELEADIDTPEAEKTQSKSQKYDLVRSPETDVPEIHSRRREDTQTVAQNAIEEAAKAAEFSADDQPAKAPKGKKRRSSTGKTKIERPVKADTPDLTEKTDAENLDNGRTETTTQDVITDEKNNLQKNPHIIDEPGTLVNNAMDQFHRLPPTGTEITTGALDSTSAPRNAVAVSEGSRKNVEEDKIFGESAANPPREKTVISATLIVQEVLPSAEAMTNEETTEPESAVYRKSQTVIKNFPVDFTNEQQTSRDKGKVSLPVNAHAPTVLENSAEEARKMSGNGEVDQNKVPEDDNEKPKRRTRRKSRKPDELQDRHRRMTPENATVPSTQPRESINVTTETGVLQNKRTLHHNQNPTVQDCDKVVKTGNEKPSYEQKHRRRSRKSSIRAENDDAGTNEKTSTDPSVDVDETMNKNKALVSAMKRSPNEGLPKGSRQHSETTTITKTSPNLQNVNGVANEDIFAPSAPILYESKKTTPEQKSRRSTSKRRSSIEQRKSFDNQNDSEAKLRGEPTLHREPTVAQADNLMKDLIQIAERSKEDESHVFENKTPVPARVRRPSRKRRKSEKNETVIIDDVPQYESKPYHTVIAAEVPNDGEVIIYPVSARSQSVLDEYVKFTTTKQELHTDSALENQALFDLFEIPNEPKPTKRTRKTSKVKRKSVKPRSPLDVDRTHSEPKHKAELELENFFGSAKETKTARNENWRLNVVTPHARTEPDFVPLPLLQDPTAEKPITEQTEGPETVKKKRRKSSTTERRKQKQKALDIVENAIVPEIPVIVPLKHPVRTPTNSVISAVTTSVIPGEIGETQIQSQMLGRPTPPSALQQRPRGLGRGSPIRPQRNFGGPQRSPLGRRPIHNDLVTDETQTASGLEPRLVAEDTRTAEAATENTQTLEEPVAVTETTATETENHVTVKEKTKKKRSKQKKTKEVEETEEPGDNLNDIVTNHLDENEKAIIELPVSDPKLLDSEGGMKPAKTKQKKNKKGKKKKEESDGEAGKPTEQMDDSRKSDILYGKAVGNFFLLEGMLGKGGFGEARKGRHVTSAKKFAIKLERIADANDSLAEEYRIYQILGQHTGFPRCYYFGVGPNEHNALVMDLLGPSLEDYYRAMDRKWSIKTVFMVAMQILERIEYVHTKGYVYSDIKPENFLTGLPEENLDDTVYLIDFGLAQQFKDKDSGKYCYDENVKTHPIGTMRYMSVRSHEGRSLSYRDDLESVGYLVIYFFRGRLPWQNMGIKDRQKKVKAVGLRKKTISMEELCQDCPSQLQEYMKYVRSIQFYAEPRYERLRSFFLTILSSAGAKDDGQFDWIGKKYDFTRNKKSDSGLARAMSTAENEDDEPKTAKNRVSDGNLDVTMKTTGPTVQKSFNADEQVPPKVCRKPPTTLNDSVEQSATPAPTTRKRAGSARGQKMGMDPSVDPLVAFKEQERKEKMERVTKMKPRTSSTLDNYQYGKEDKREKGMRKNDNDSCHCC